MMITDTANVIDLPGVDSIDMKHSKAGHMVDPFILDGKKPAISAVSRNAQVIGLAMLGSCSIRPKYKHTSHERDLIIGSVAHWPVLLNVQQAAKLAEMSVSTIYSRVSRGLHKKSVIRKGALRFHRDLFLLELLGVI